MSYFESGSFDAVIDKGIIVIVVLDSIMEEIVNICICIGNMALCSNPICYCRNTRFYYSESSFCQDT